MLNLNTEESKLSACQIGTDTLAMLEGFERSPYYPRLFSWCPMPKTELKSLIDLALADPQLKHLAERCFILLEKWQLQSFSPGSTLPNEVLKLLLKIRAYSKLKVSFESTQWVESNDEGIPIEAWCMHQGYTIRIPLIDLTVQSVPELDSIFSTSCSLRELIACISQKIKTALAQIKPSDTPTIALLVTSDNFGWLNPQSLTPYYLDSNGQTCLLPGILWTAIFGSIGNVIPCIQMNSDESAIEGELDFNGVLAGYEDIKAPAVSILQPTDDRIFTLHARHYSDISPENADIIMSSVKKLSQFYNDNENTNGSTIYAM